MQVRPVTPGQAAIQGGFGDVVNLISAVGEYRNSQEQGDNAAVSLAKGVGNFAWGEFYYGGIARILNEGPLGFIGKTGSAIGSTAGTGIGGIIGGGAGLFAKHPIKGAVVGGKIGGIAGGIAGNIGTVMAMTLLPHLAGQIPAYWENTAGVMSKAYRQRGKLGSGYFSMTQAGYTMRQRSLNTIRQNGLNTQSVLGNEARTYFRNSGLDN